MKIYTKTGDGGTTQLLTGERVSKDHPRIIALGYLDEATSHIGKVRSLISDERIQDMLKKIQKLFIKLMGAVASSYAVIDTVTEEDVKVLEQIIDYYAKYVGEFQGFVLPGENPIATEIDIARAVVRRAETAVIGCNGLPIIIQYLNRLSDYLYILARYIEQITVNHLKKIEEEKITLEIANIISQKVRKYAESQGCRVVVAVVSPEGRPISVEVMDGAFVISYDLAIKKAFTAVALQMPNHELGKLTARGEEFEGLENMLNEKIVTLGGGCPLYINNSLIGGIGVSGGSEAQDIEFAAYGMEVLKKEGIK